MGKLLNKDFAVTEHYNKAVEIALVLVEKEARRVLKKHDYLGEFVMGMGTWFFTSKGNDMQRIDNEDRAPELAEFIEKWDDYLCLTGHPMRFTATGDRIESW